MKNEINWVQYLRGLAAMMVVWHHALGQVPGTFNFIHVPEFGPLGVDLFFTISGFIMLVTTWNKPMTPSEFLWRRLCRIAPLYWIATLAMVGIAALAPSLFKTLQWDGASLVKSLGFIPYDSLAAPGRIAPLLVPGWTLNYEMFFYVLFAGSLIFIPRDGFKVVLLTLLFLVLAGLIVHPTTPVWSVYTSARLLEFGFGMVIGRWYVSRKWKRRDVAYPALSALGDASYSIYLTHIFTLGALRVVWSAVVPQASMASSVILMAISMALCAFVGWLSYRLIEVPIAKALKGRRPSGVARWFKNQYNIYATWRTVLRREGEQGWWI